MDADDTKRPHPFGQDHSILVVGGGTAGWMAAATLRRRLGCKVTLVESATDQGVGVGEATIPAMIDWLNNMGIDEDEFLCETGGTFKLAIRFDNWVTAEHRYWHPFGVCGGSIDGLDLIHHYRRGIDEGWIAANVPYTHFSLQRQFCENHRSPRRAEDSPSELGNYAYHLDAGKLAAFIRTIALRDGVVHRIGDVVDASLSESGDIQQVHLRDDVSVQADLFIDCTGFAGVLIGRTLRSRWVDWSNVLLCDKAVVAKAPRATGEFPPFTVSTGMNAGWAWQIPLNDNIGTGYVYSSKHIDGPSARQQLLSHAGLDSDTPTRELSMRVGHRTESWIGNCVSLGLASGFVEPLESTGIFLVQLALDALVDCLPSATGVTPQRSEFNDRMQHAYEEVRDFVLLHYVVSHRDDTAFWRDARNVELPESLRVAMHAYREHGDVALGDDDQVFAPVNHHFIMAGAGILPPSHSTAAVSDAVELIQILKHIYSQNVALAEQFLSHHELMRAIHPLPVTCSAQ